MLMCKRVALEASGNRHALHTLMATHCTGSRTDCSGILVRYTITFSSNISSNVVSNIK